VTSVLLSLLHLGALHPFEKGLTLLLAFGPFVVLAVVVAVRRRQDAAAEAGEVSGTQAGGTEASGNEAFGGSAPPQPPPPPTD